MRQFPPLTVTRFIVALVADAVERHSRRRFAHICEEGFEAFAPAFANFNASAAVIFELACLRIAAALDHGVPGIIGPRVGPMFGVAVA